VFINPRNEANVQIEKKQHLSTSPAPAATNRQAKVARDQAALLPTRLALARWAHGGDVPHVFAAANRPSRALWYAQAERDFQCWLEAGGLHQLGGEGSEDEGRHK
jgi:hypothetical protein